jgi:hypothetical protein
MTDDIAARDDLQARYPAIVACIEDSAIVTGSVRESAAIELAGIATHLDSLERREITRAMCCVENEREVVRLRESVAEMEWALLRIQACAADQFAMHIRDGWGLDVTGRITAILSDAAAALSKARQ